MTKQDGQQSKTSDPSQTQKLSDEDLNELLKFTDSSQEELREDLVRGQGGNFTGSNANGLSSPTDNRNSDVLSGLEDLLGHEETEEGSNQACENQKNSGGANSINCGVRSTAPANKCGDVVSVPKKGSPMNSPCLLYTSPSPRDATLSRMPSSA